MIFRIKIENKIDTKKLLYIKLHDLIDELLILDKLLTSFDHEIIIYLILNSILDINNLIFHRKMISEDYH